MLHALLAGLLVAQPVPPSPDQTAPVPSPSASPGVLSVSPATLQLNPAQQRTLQVSGASGQVSATAEQRLVTVAVDPASGSIVVTATQATGSDIVHVVDAGGGVADVPVRVAFDAGTIVSQTNLQVTGTPAGDAWLASTIRAAVLRLTPPQYGARTAVGDPQPATQSM
ncbi:MAG: hypothetical protein ABI431_07410, partial [Candidatus Tumulicola sp.]